MVSLAIESRVRVDTQIADAIVSISCPEACFLTGQTIFLDGGITTG